MARHKMLTLALGLLALGTGVAVALYALLLGYTIEASPVGVANSAKGHQIAVPAVIAIVTGVVALGGRRRAWGLLVGGVGLAAAVVAVVLAIVIPGG